MQGTRRHGHRGPGTRREAAGTPMYWGWSPDSGQMEMMDLRRYVDAVRAGYDRALEDLYGRVSALSGAYGAGAPAGVPGMAPWPVPGPSAGRRGRHGGGCCDDADDDGHGEHGCGHGHGHHGCGHGHGEGHGHHGCGQGHGEGHGHHGEDEGHGHHGGGHHGGCGHHRRHEHGCADDTDCRCECCIVDADIVVYARCGEVRVVPIEIENDTRKDREDVELEVGEFRSGGGQVLAWKAALSPKGPLTIRGCSTARLELLVGVVCARAPVVVNPGKDVKAPKEPARPAASEGGGAVDQLVRLATDVRDTGGVDSCTVGYVTVEVGGCLVRPIVVAVAVLPDDCGAYAASCSCGACC